METDKNGGKEEKWTGAGAARVGRERRGTAPEDSQNARRLERGNVAERLAERQVYDGEEDWRKRRRQQQRRRPRRRRASQRARWCTRI